MNLVFCGTPQFAVPTLDALTNAGHRIQLVITQPDRPSGRRNQLATSQVKKRALELKLPVAQPLKLKDNTTLRSQLQSLNPAAIVVVAYGRLIPGWLLRLPQLGCLNVHASLLPKYRGAAPIQWAIARGESQTGVTIMQLDEGLDTGPILLQQELGIAEEDTAVTLGPRLATLGADLMLQALESIAAGTASPAPQDHSRATLAPLLKKADGQIDFSQTATELVNRLRGFQPWPGAYTKFRGRLLEVISARIGRPISPIGPARITVEQKRLYFGCGAGTVLEVMEVQPEGKKRMSTEQFLSGYRPLHDETLGS